MRLTIPKYGILYLLNIERITKLKNKIKPILKWAGGKTSELPMINKYLPKKINKYYEPFIGGGALWLSRDWGEMYVNDFSTDLISLYENIKEGNQEFFSFIEYFNEAWLKIGILCKEKSDDLTLLYKNFKNDIITLDELLVDIDLLVQSEKQIRIKLNNNNSDEFIIKYLLDKFKRTKKNEIKKGELPEEDYIKNIETGIKAGLYMFVRNLYNRYLTEKEDFGKAKNSSIYFIIRDLCYSGMFRFNKNGEFNVPYGGMGYNGKDFINKLTHMKSESVLKHFNKTTINQDDFYDFMNKYIPNKNDFIFLDPPYDTEFSEYDGNSFEKKDQERLADFLINKCESNWMVVIKYTDFIHSLYNKEGINIVSFDKKYAVSFMDRNNQEVSHIIIRNYE